MKTHRLKTWPDFFEAVLDGRKTFEIRFDDRGFEVGDVLVLEEYLPDAKTYTGRSLRRVVVYATTFRQLFGFVVLGLRTEKDAPGVVEVAE